MSREPDEFYPVGGSEPGSGCGELSTDYGFGIQSENSTNSDRDYGDSGESTEIKSNSNKIMMIDEFVCDCEGAMIVKARINACISELSQEKQYKVVEVIEEPIGEIPIETLLSNIKFLAKTIPNINSNIGKKRMKKNIILWIEELERRQKEK